jgi:adenosylcobinamide kinase / adenosylcobinamide-phosphate guanylyltransferase
MSRLRKPFAREFALCHDVDLVVSAAQGVGVHGNHFHHRRRTVGKERSGGNARTRLSGQARIHRDRRGARCRDARADCQAPALNETDGGGARLVDCLTLWLSNLLHAGRDWAKEAESLTVTLVRQTSPVVLVTNEVGLGIVPDNALARQFRDASGVLNQMIARVADEVEFMVAGLPMRVK